MANNVTTDGGDRIQAVALYDRATGSAAGSASGNAVSRIPSSAATTNATSAKAAAGKLFFVGGYNASASVAYLKLYNKATAPVVGTDVPFFTLALPPTAVFVYDFTGGFVFETGIAYGLTADAADAGTTAVASGAILGLNVGFS